MTGTETESETGGKKSRVKGICVSRDGKRRAFDFEMGRRALASLGTLLPLIAALLAFHLVAEEAEGIWLNLPATGTKCVSEDIQHNVVVLADYVVVSEDHSHYPTISVKVSSAVPFDSGC